ncbi:MAG: nuclear transport factor 2 family protein [Mariniphaga sp.]|nr:nuclear transport factor 2 family protein [Mariniphaga sp.]
MKKVSISFKVLLPATVIAIFFLFSCQTGIKENQNSYAEDRALIEDLQARYMFALDNDDLDTYILTFTEDGILDIGEGEWKGRDFIKNLLSSMPQEEPAVADSGLHRTTGRHNISNIVLKIEGDTAWGRAYWFHMSNENPQRKPQLNSYGHYEDEMVKVDGEWLFSKRKIYNEEIAKWAAPEGNPSW